MKTISILSCLLSVLMIAGAQAQSSVKEANIRFAKVERPGLLAEYPYGRVVVENALRGRLERTGFGKPKTEKGFNSYRGVTWPEIAPGQLDVYTRVEGKAEQSNIVLLVSKGYDNYVSGVTDAAMSMKLKTFFNTLLPDIQAEQLRAEMGVQEEVIRRAEKAFKDSDEDGNRLSREKERIEKQMADNEAEKARRGESLNAERSKLDALKAKMK